MEGQVRGKPVRYHGNVPTFIRLSDWGRASHEGTVSMTDSKDKKTTITLEPGQVAIVLGMEDGQISRQLFASPEVDAMLDDEKSEIPFHYFLASAFLVRLDQDENFASDLAEWYDEKLNGEAGEADTGQ
jgi:hypothetical protein